MVSLDGAHAPLADPVTDGREGREGRGRIAVISIDAKLPGELQGATRYTYIARRLVEAGYAVDLITSSFQHWTKRQRDLSNFLMEGEGTDARLEHGVCGYGLVFLHEPGYSRNVGLARISSHKVAVNSLKEYLATGPAYDLVYCQIPPNNLSRAAAEYAYRAKIPFVVDVNDLWPEAMRMAFDVPVVSDALFSGFTRDAARTYRLSSAVVGTSEEYADRPFRDRPRDVPRRVVYVGNDITAFDDGVLSNRDDIVKPADEFWVTYAGNLSTSYDIPAVIEASAMIDEGEAGGAPHVCFKVLGDGPAREQWEALAHESSCSVEFLGYQPFERMAAYLAASDATLNSLVKGAPQSIPTKIGDYLAAGRPMINVSESPELMALVADDDLGINVAPGDAQALAQAVLSLAGDAGRCAEMGVHARRVAETRFDRAESYRVIVELVDELVGKVPFEE